MLRSVPVGSPVRPTTSLDRSLTRAVAPYPPPSVSHGKGLSMINRSVDHLVWFISRATKALNLLDYPC